MENKIESNENAAHPFERTLGPGPYKYVGFFYINIQAGQMGRPYVNPHDVHPRFVTGAGTCAHCGQAILNVCQIQIGNGDVYGVGLDCVNKVHLPVKERTAIEKAKLAHEKELRAKRKAKKGDAAREKIRALIAEHGQVMDSLKHPANIPDRSLLDYAEWILEKSNDGGVVFALKKIEFHLNKKD